MPVASLVGVDLEKMKVAELKALCKERGLKVIVGWITTPNNNA